MINKRIEVEIDEYVDIYLDVDDIIEYLDNCHDIDLNHIKDYLNVEFNINIEINNLNDRDKFLLIKDLYNNYALDDIQRIVGWEPGKGIDKNL